MFYPVELIATNYKPLLLEKEMLFKRVHKEGREYEYIEIWELERVPNANVERFADFNGYPVHLHLLTEDEIQLTDEDEDEVLNSWWDEGDHTDELRDISLKDINIIFEEYDGLLEIDVNIEDIMDKDVATPVLTEGRFTLRFLEEDVGDEDKYFISLN